MGEETNRKSTQELTNLPIRQTGPEPSVNLADSNNKAFKLRVVEITNNDLWVGMTNLNWGITVGEADATIFNSLTYEGSTYFTYTDAWANWYLSYSEMDNNAAGLFLWPRAIGWTFKGSKLVTDDGNILILESLGEDNDLGAYIYVNPWKGYDIQQVFVD